MCLRTVLMLARVAVATFKVFSVVHAVCGRQDDLVAEEECQSMAYRGMHVAPYSGACELRP